MRAMVLDARGAPLRLRERQEPSPEAGEVLIKVSTCGVCRTDLHVLDGELPDIRYPIVPGHEVIGRIVARGAGVDQLAVGERVGVPWLGWTCGVCWYCRHGQENLCERARFTGCQRDGGYAEMTVADARYCFRVPSTYGDATVAPLLCAGLIGYRCLRKAGEGKALGIYGFGAAAHIVAQVARHQGRKIYAFTRPGDSAAQQFALSLGAVWAGASDQRPPQQLDAAIIFAPVGSLVVEALRSVRPGGRVVCGGIHMSDIPAFQYELLWREREIVSVANLTRRDGEEFLALAPEVPIRTEIETFPLEAANEALIRLRAGTLRGAAVLLTG
jgi:propanol-preferring alcohol dehydrogenase